MRLEFPDEMAEEVATAIEERIDFLEGAVEEQARLPDDLRDREIEQSAREAMAFLRGLLDQFPQEESTT